VAYSDSGSWCLCLRRTWIVNCVESRLIISSVLVTSGSPFGISFPHAEHTPETGRDFSSYPIISSGFLGMVAVYGNERDPQ
jgi:hypothetical protein